MIGVIGVKRNVDIAIREKLALYPKKHKKYVGELLNSFKEVVILNTCNRTEIYFNCTEEISEDEIFDKIFNVFKSLTYMNFFSLYLISHYFTVLLHYYKLKICSCQSSALKKINFQHLPVS